MKAILYILTILVAGGAIVFTRMQSTKFENVQKDRIKIIAESKSILADASVKEKELSDEKAIFAAAEQKRDELKQSIDTLEATASTLKRDGVDLDNTLKGQEQEFADLNKTLEEVNTIVAGLGGGITLDNLSEKVQEIDADKKAKQAKLEESETLMSAAEKSLVGSRAESDRFAKRIIDRKARIGRNAMEAVITAVDQEWGFLVIGAGSNSGFTPQTNLIVQRDGRMIGRVHPSSVELNQTIAEIDFKSLATGVRIQPGDRVLLTSPSSN
jgi:hypothetical protein